MSLLKKAILNQKITKTDIEYALYNICDSVHASCDSECPVYSLNGEKCPPEEGGFEYGCSCFKKGKAMLNFIEKHMNEFKRMVY